MSRPPKPTPQITASLTISHPRAEDIRLRSGDTSDSTFYAFHLDIAPWYQAALSLGGSDADCEADAAAMDRLAEVALEAAAKLRAAAALHLGEAS
jgi:hypothetical protein